MAKIKRRRVNGGPSKSSLLRALLKENPRLTAHDLVLEMESQHNTQVSYALAAQVRKKYGGYAAKGTRRTGVKLTNTAPSFSGVPRPSNGHTTASEALEALLGGVTDDVRAYSNAEMIADIGQARFFVSECMGGDAHRALLAIQNYAQLLDNVFAPSQS